MSTICVTATASLCALCAPQSERNASTRPLLREIAEVRAVDGVVQLTLTAKTSTVAIGDSTVRSVVYNDSSIPPTIRVSRGERIELTLINNADENTNIHYHGMQISPLDYGDNIWTMVPPGHEYTYSIAVPLYHEPGLYWHHSHAHQASERLVMSGLAGSVIVEGVLEGWPELAAANLRERTLALRTIQPAWNGDLTWGVQTSMPQVSTVNGQSDPLIDIRPGETQLWRIVNQASDRYFNLELGGHPFFVVATDGNPVPVMSEAKRFLLAPAGRVEILVQGPSEGELALTTRQIRTGPAGDGYPAVRLATLVSAGEAIQPLALPAKRTGPNQPLDMRTLKTDNERTIVFDETDNDFRVNNAVFVGSRIDTRVAFGTVERWKIVNATAELHAFHIHQTDFQVVAINGKEQEFTGHLDTVTVPIYGSVEIMLAFTEPCVLGQFVSHCHILEHEDGGLMATIEVYDPKSESAHASEANSARSDEHEVVRAAHPTATGGAFALIGSDGQPRSEGDFDGLSLLTFGYTRCRGACPRILATFAAVAAEIGTEPMPEFAFISVDASRENDARLAEYEQKSPVKLVAMRGSPEATAATARVFGAAYEPQPPASDGSYTVRHSTDIYLVGPGGRIFERFALTTEPKVIADALRRFAVRVPHATTRIAVQTSSTTEGGAR